MRSKGRIRFPFSPHEKYSQLTGEVDVNLRDRGNSLITLIAGKPTHFNT
jgi:hypothetical protein